MEKHEDLRAILIKYNCPEFGDVIIDEICRVFNYPDTNGQSQPRFRVTFTKSGDPDFPVRAQCNGQHVDDYTDKPEEDIVIAMYREQLAEGIL